MSQPKITDFFTSTKSSKKRSEPEEDTEEVEENEAEKVEKSAKKSTTITTTIRKNKKNEKNEKSEEEEDEEDTEEESKPKKATKSKKPVTKKKKKNESDEEADDNEEQSEVSLAGDSSSDNYSDLLDYLTDESWKEALKSELQKDYIKGIIRNLNKLAKESDKPIYPPKNEIFTALNWTPLDKVKVVIVGQDPYHGPGQAHGLSFSVKKGIKAPPSLANIYKELISDIPGFKTPNHGFLEKWAKQGVLMLNDILTVTQATPNSHKSFGWKHLTDAIMRIINERRENIVFIFWGDFAKKKGSVVSRTKHHIIESGHPSPLSVKHFRDSKPFSKTNDYLKSIGQDEIDWTLPATI